MALDLPAPPPLVRLGEAAPVALFLDFDGTLVELADTPDGIDVPDALAARIERLGERLGGRLALVSGRALDNLEHHLGALRIASGGSHGADLRGSDGTALGEGALSLPESAVNAIKQFADRTGARYERKTHGAALHSRGHPAIEEDAARFMEDLADRHALEVKRGKFVVELVQPGADKGAAVRAFMERPPFAGARPIFVGDDLTDEDGFAAARALGGLAIAVGPRRTENADYALADPAAVHQWLEL